MVWLDMMDLVANNVGMSFEFLTVLILTIGAMVFVAKDFKLFLVAEFTTMAGVFIWFYEVGLQWWIPLSLLLMSLVIMTFTIFASDKTSPTGGIA